MKIQIYSTHVYRPSKRKKVRREWRWRLRAANGRILAAATESYYHRAHCRKMAAKCCPHVTVVEELADHGSR